MLAAHQWASMLNKTLLLLVLLLPVLLPAWLMAMGWDMGCSCGGRWHSCGSWRARGRLLLGHCLLRFLWHLLALLLLLPLLLPAQLSTSSYGRSCGRRWCSSGGGSLGP